jgi:hypothetical protein
MAPGVRRSMSTPHIVMLSALVITLPAGALFNQVSLGNHREAVEDAHAVGPPDYHRPLGPTQTSSLSKDETENAAWRS